MWRDVGARCARAPSCSSPRVELELAADLPMFEWTPVLFEQALFNLLDNAAKYAPAGTTIRIRAGATGPLSLQVLDEGTAFRRASWSIFSTSSTAPRRATCARGHRPLVSRSAAASSNHAAARSSPENRGDRAGAVFTIALPVPENATAGPAA